MAGEDAERRAFRRRLGFTLSRVRSSLTQFTQQGIADELGVDVETVGRWERGDREPKAFELNRLARLYQIPGEWLLFPTDSITEMDVRIATRPAEELARAAIASSRRSLEQVAVEPRAAEVARGGRRGKRPA